MESTAQPPRNLVLLQSCGCGCGWLLWRKGRSGFWFFFFLLSAPSFGPGSGFLDREPPPGACSSVAVVHRRSVTSGLVAEAGITVGEFDTGLSLS